MTRTDLIQQLTSRCAYLTPTDAQAVVVLFCQQITAAVARGDSVTFRCFGRFSQRVFPPRPGRNPKTGERLALSSKKKMVFKASKALHKALNEGVKR